MPGEVRLFVRNLGNGHEERLVDPGALAERLLDQLSTSGASSRGPEALAGLDAHGSASSSELIDDLLTTRVQNRGTS